MRIEIHGNNIVTSPELKRHAEVCTWLAAQRHSRRIAWVSVRFTEYTGQNEPRRTLCQIDLWLRRARLITICHTDTNPYVAVDLASTRLKQALRRRFRRRRAQRPAATGLHTERLGRIARPLLSSPPRLAVAEPEELVALAPWHDIAVRSAEPMAAVTPTVLMDPWPLPEATQCTM